VGCVPSYDEYTYIGIDSTEFQVDKVGQSVIGESVAALWFHNDMPIEYSYTATEYTIHVSVVLDSTRPQLKITSEMPGGLQVQTGGQVVDDCFGFVHNEKYENASLEETWPVLFYTWTKRGLPHCDSRKAEFGEPMDLRLRVVDISGRRIGDETVSLTLQKNGTYVYWDGP
jgi:hypothetical protein